MTANMQRLLNGFGVKAVSALLVCLAVVAPSLASHHFESDLSRQYPQFDITDLFVFDSEQPNYTSFMMNVNPATARDGKPGFGENGVYSFHIAFDKAAGLEGITITASLQGDEWSFGMAEGANAAIGVKGNTFGKAKVGTTKVFGNGIKVWTGAARDTFVGNSEGILGFMGKLLGHGQFDLSAFDKGVDLFKDFQSSVILIEVPNSILSGKIYTYASSAMYLKDTWVQVNRLANPLMTHMFMANNKMEIAEHVHHRPDSDASREYAVSGVTLRAVVLDGKMALPVAYADKVAKMMLPDMIPYQVGSKAKYSFESINGRNPADDAMDAVLSILVGREITDNANTFDRHPQTFPYVVPINP
ncbi:DUF4331 domain-containing protein [Shewanella submarina]|uniref:DUF4331 family protein n=1 Tax=Shewanella submarina TaxID=2016376 RepID=A0ABV7GL34_9GAMM|nr:DUF4331 family protein [Shewanella submarina]MCL1036078.1 DUF4331 domain-containing protein [Shewanella submarina]